MAASRTMSCSMLRGHSRRRGVPRSESLVHEYEVNGAPHRRPHPDLWMEPRRPDERDRALDEPRIPAPGPEADNPPLFVLGLVADGESARAVVYGLAHPRSPDIAEGFIAPTGLNPGEASTTLIRGTERLRSAPEARRGH